MSRIVFVNERPIAQTDPGRTDVACFVGLIRRVHNAVLPNAVNDWLKLQGWVDGPFARPLAHFKDVPIPIETYPAFTALFDAGGSAESFGTDYVAVAVRAFFAQGGKRCYVVRMGNPVSPLDSAAKKKEKFQRLLPDSTFAAGDQRSWHGVGHLSGLPDVSYLVTPDLPVLAASGLQGALGQTPTVPSGPEQFKECSNQDLTVTPALQYASTAPRLAPNDYATWAAGVRTILQFLSNGSLRELQFVAAFPMPQNSGVATAAENPSSAVTQDIHDAIAAQMEEETGLEGSISSAFLQLAYPWLKTTGSSVLLEALEPPDGALAGIQARNALVRGAFRSATKINPSEIYDLSPVLPAQETNVQATPLQWGPHSPAKPLIERFSLFGFTPNGLALLSDVTAYPGESYRPARIHRLISIILRASRRLGEEATFQSNGPALWTHVQTFLRNLMTRLWELNALDGATLSDAFTVRCDRSTMTQNDLDNGRLVAIVSFNAAATIELIQVTLAMQTSGAGAQNVAILAEAG